LGAPKYVKGQGIVLCPYVLHQQIKGILMNRILAICMLALALVIGVLVGSTARLLNKRAEAVNTAIVELQELSQATAASHAEFVLTCTSLASNDTVITSVLTQVANGSIANRQVLVRLDAIFVEYYGARKWKRMIDDGVAAPPVKLKK
jgi:hypothetical protein